MSIFDLFRRNGHAVKSPLALAQEQVELVEAGLKLKMLHQQDMLTESYQSPWSRSWDDYPYRHHTPTDTPITGLFADLPITDNLEELGRARDLARKLVRQNPFATGALDCLVNFIVGEGMRYTVATKDKAGGPLIAVVQDVWDEFAFRTLWSEWEQEIVRRTWRDGEVFLRYFDLGAGYLDMRIIEPEWVKDTGSRPAALDDGTEVYWRHGIGFDIRDKQRPLCYWVEYPDEAGECIPAVEVEHIKTNVDRNVPRGLSNLYSTSEVLSGVDKLLRNMRIGEATRAAITGFWSYADATASQVQAHVDAVKNKLQPRGSTTDPVTGKTDNYQAVHPGSFVHVPKGKTFQAPPTSPATSSQVQVEQACLRAVAAREQMPEYMISGDASNANYSSSLISGSPFSRSIISKQGFFRNRFLRLAWKVVEVAAKGGRVTTTWAQVEGSLEIQIEAKPPELSNEMELAQVDSIDMQAGVLSKQTRRMRRGLDDEQEAENIKADPMAPAAPAGGAPPALPPGMPAFGNPYAVRQDVEKWQVVKARTGEVVGEHPTKEAALKHFAALEANVKEALELLQECMTGPNKGKPGPCPESTGTEYTPADKGSKSEKEPDGKAQVATVAGSEAFAPDEQWRIKSTPELNALADRLDDETIVYVPTKLEKSFKIYSTDAYREINQDIKSGDIANSPHKKTIEAMQVAFAGTPALKPPPVIAYRGLSLDQADFGKFQDSIRKAIESEMPIEMQGFISTSTNIQVARSFSAAPDKKSVVLEIAVKKGIYLGSIAPLNEREMLLNHKSKFRVIGEKTITVSGDITQRVIQLEQIA